MRLPAFRGPESLWRSMLVWNPHSFLANNNLTTILTQRTHATDSPNLHKTQILAHHTPQTVTDDVDRTNILHTLERIAKKKNDLEHTINLTHMAVRTSLPRHPRTALNLTKLLTHANKDAKTLHTY